MAAFIAGEKLICDADGYTFRAMTPVEIEYPYLLNPAKVAFVDSIANTGDNDLYTVATGKRAFIASSRIYTAGAVTFFLNLKRGGVYYKLAIATSLGVANGAVAAGFVFEAGDIISFNHSGADAVNYNLGIVTFDAPTSGARGLKTYPNFAPIDGLTTLCTVAANCVMQFPNIGVNGGVLLGGGSASVGFIFNASGGSRALAGYIVPSGDSADGTTQFFGGSTNNDTRGTMTPAGYMAAGTSFIMSTNSATTQQTMWVTTLETSA